MLSGRVEGAYSNVPTVFPIPAMRKRMMVAGTRLWNCAEPLYGTHRNERGLAVLLHASNFRQQHTEFISVRFCLVACSAIQRHLQHHRSAYSSILRLHTHSTAMLIQCNFILPEKLRHAGNTSNYTEHLSTHSLHMSLLFIHCYTKVYSVF